MGRLLDMEEIIRLAKTTYPTDDVKKITWLLCHTPTAYNVDKVVEELEKLPNREADYYYANSNDVIDREDAIEIVKQGGVGTESKTIRENANGYSKEDIELNRNAMYNKAIDDFVNKINESNQGHWRPTRYEHGEVVSETMSYDIGTIRLIAEQLKAGEQNE